MLQFARQEWLWLLVIAPLLAVVATLAKRRHQRDWRRIGQSGRLEPTGTAQWILAAVCLAVAIAQPRWGRIRPQNAVKGQDVVIAVDLSRSMGAEDALPNRLGLAKETAKTLVEALGDEPGHRAAVVGFAGRGALLCPLTENLGAVLDAVESLRIGEIEPNGTNLGAAIDACLEAFDEPSDVYDRGSIVLFTDGEDHPRSWQSRLEALNDRGIIVHSVAIGDSDRGEIVPEQAGNPSLPHKYRNAVVISKRDDEPLEAISNATGGALIKLGISPLNLGTLYKTRIEPVARSNRTGLRSPEPADHFTLFLLAAFSFCLSADWGGWRRLFQGRIWSTWSIAAMLTVVISGADEPSSVIDDTMNRGLRAYATGRYGEALTYFEKADRDEPSNPVILFDLAATFFQLERYADAYETYQAAAANGADERLQTAIDFGLGNTAVALRDLEGALKHYDECIASTAVGEEARRVREDALLNKTYVEEQARKTPAAGDEETGAKNAPEPRNEPPTSKVARKSSENDESKRRSDSDSNPGSNGGGAREPNRRRTTGGQGGSGQSPRSSPAEERLERAIETVKDAQQRRIGDSPTGSSKSADKDW